jgi:hypothetical protein
MALDLSCVNEGSGSYLVTATHSLSIGVKERHLRLNRRPLASNCSRKMPKIPLVDLSGTTSHGACFSANNSIASANVSMLAGSTRTSRRLGSRDWTVVSLVSCRLLVPHVPCPVPRPVSRSSRQISFQRNAISRLGDSFRPWEAAPDKRR